MLRTTVSVLALVAAAAPCGASFPGDAWEETEPEAQGVDSTGLEAALAYLRENSGRDGTHEVMVVRHGRLIWHGDRVDHVHGIWSATKSFTSTVLGLLIEDGKCTLDTPAAAVLRQMATAYPGVTLRHFTTMTSGYRAMGDEPRGSYAHGPSPTPFEPSPEPLFPPGTRYAYWDSAMNQYGHALTRLAGEPLVDLFRRRLAAPIGMNPKQWRWGDFGVVDGLVVNGGAGNHNQHVMISARELARFGLLFLNRGKWSGEQLLSAEWIAAATRCQVARDLPLGHPSSADGRGVYGYNWWVNGSGPAGQPKWPGAPAGTFAASGFNNNDLFVIPEWDMVVVRLGLDEQERKITDDVYGEFLARLGAAVTRAGHAPE